MSTVPNEFRIKWPPKETWTDATREVQSFWGEPNSWEEGSKTNIINVMANHPPLALAWSHYGKYFMTGHTLNNRQLEFVVLRVAVLVNSIYEWHNHVGYAMQAGITLEEIAQIRDFPEAANEFTEEERAILSTCDELIKTNNVSDATWATLQKTLSQEQMMDLVMLVGNYVMTSWAISAFGVPIEGGADAIGFDLKTKSGKTPGVTYRPGESEDWIEKRGY
ncbi:carboxymuconolactone decarboxylase family protein [Novosphingobium sp. TH158]|uniref:carboxymuconolactone decarboxylase family protein n=1 Tax=Novosphingobium sp. TH158 TaxID=2067455 RepID=UPI0020B12F16|nr:carboxymuconolactone decarboxylase family protein [Novosphingobium sp. TH158]